jgi:hypothetical protein
MFKQYIHQTYIAMSRSLTGEAGGWLGLRQKENPVTHGKPEQ